MSRTYVALDLETTGLKPAQDAIIEVGAVKFARGAWLDELTRAEKINGIPECKTVLERFALSIGEFS